MQIDAKQIKKGSKKRIGHLNGDNVYELQTVGGLAMVILAKAGAPKVLGLAPHKAIARHIAKEKEEELVIDELSKSEDLSLEMFKHLVPTWSNITERVEEKLGG